MLAPIRPSPIIPISIICLFLSCYFHPVLRVELCREFIDYLLRRFLVGCLCSRIATHEPKRMRLERGVSAIMPRIIDSGKFSCYQLEPESPCLSSMGMNGSSLFGAWALGYLCPIPLSNFQQIS